MPHASQHKNLGKANILAPPHPVKGDSMSSAPRLKMALPFLHEANWMRQTARFVLAGWLLPVFFALFAAFNSAPAHAQSPVQTVVVLDFAAANGLDPLLGRKAADGLAVELQRSGDFEVVPRARVEQAVAQQAGLQPPFNDTAQIQLAQTVNAKSVFSGRILGVNVVPGKSATVAVEVRQLDAATGDYLNGTQVVEPAEQRLSTVANEILIDEAINKAVFSAVRSMRQTALPTGTVLNTTRDDVELNIGARNGVAMGQRYSVLRDIYNRAKNVTTREKVAEITIVSVQSDQAIARVSAGGAAGVRTSDRVRQIFVPGTYPVSVASTSGGSVTPVTSRPVTATPKESFAKKSSKGLLGLVGLAALVGLAGFGGGGGSSSPRAGQVREGSPNTVYPTGTFTFTPGFTGINFSQTLQREAVVAYLIYRGETAGFTPDVSNLQAVLDARSFASSTRYTFTDPALNGGNGAAVIRRLITITENQGDDNNNNGGTNTSTIEYSSESAADGADSYVQDEDGIEIEFTQRPLVIGRTYYYRVARITAERTKTTTTGTGNNTEDTTTINLTPTLSPVSGATGAYTPLYRPVIQTPTNPVDNQGHLFNTDALVLRVNTDFTDYFTNVGNLQTFIDARYRSDNTPNAGDGADQWQFQVSTASDFNASRTFVSQIYPTPSAGTLQDLVFNLGDIRVPTSTNDPYEPGVTPLYVRALVRNSADAIPTFRIGETYTITPGLAGGADSLAATSRFLATPAGARGGGVSIGRGGTGIGAASAGTSVTPRVLRPR